MARSKKPLAKKSLSQRDSEIIFNTISRNIKINHFYLYVEIGIIAITGTIVAYLKITSNEIILILGNFICAVKIFLGAVLVLIIFEFNIVGVTSNWYKLESSNKIFQLQLSKVI